MPKPLSFDLRSRVLSAIDEGLSCRQAAAPVRRERVERDPLAGSAPRRRRRASQAAGRRPALAPDEAHAGLIHAALDEIPTSPWSS